jgi:uncharacterized protein YicC (UPF0701 family)
MQELNREANTLASNPRTWTPRASRST